MELSLTHPASLDPPVCDCKHLGSSALDSPWMISYSRALCSSLAEAVGCEGSSSASLAFRAHVRLHNHLQNASCPSMHLLRGLRERRSLSPWLCLGAAARVILDPSPPAVCTGYLRPDGKQKSWEWTLQLPRWHSVLSKWTPLSQRGTST